MYEQQPFRSVKSVVVNKKQKERADKLQPKIKRNPTEKKHIILIIKQRRKPGNWQSQRSEGHKWLVGNVFARQCRLRVKSHEVSSSQITPNFIVRDKTLDYQEITLWVNFLFPNEDQNKRKTILTCLVEEILTSQSSSYAGILAMHAQIIARCPAALTQSCTPNIHGKETKTSSFGFKNTWMNPGGEVAPLQLSPCELVWRFEIEIMIILRCRGGKQLNP